MRDGPPGAPAAAAPPPPPPAPAPAPLRTCGRPSAPRPRLRAEPCRRRSASLRRSGAALPPPAPRGRRREEEETAASRGAGGSRWKVGGRGLVPSWEPGTPLPGLRWGREAPLCRAGGAGCLPAISSAGLRVAARLQMRPVVGAAGKVGSPRHSPRGAAGAGAELPVPASKGAEWMRGGGGQGALAGSGDVNWVGTAPKVPLALSAGYFPS